MRGQLGGDQDGRGAVRAADDADGSRFVGEKAQDQGHAVGQVDAQLSGRAQDQGLGVGDEGTEVRHGADAHEDQAGVDAQLDAEIEVVEKTTVFGICQNGPVDVAALVDLRVVEFRARQVGEQHAEGDGEQQQRLELLHDRQIQQHAGDEDHHQLQRIIEDLIEAGRF